MKRFCSLALGLVVICMALAGCDTGSGCASYGDYRRAAHPHDRPAGYSADHSHARQRQPRVRAAVHLTK